MFDYLDAWCQKCIYYAKSTRSCDFFIIEDRLRGCPGGEGCRARRTKKDVRKSMQPKWDTALGKEMWSEGKSDVEIARHFGIASNTVLHQRRKYWENEGKCTPPEDIQTENVSDAVEVGEIEGPAASVVPVVSEVLPALYDVLEAATQNMQGIQAICTAEAISQLWNWSSRENLLRARAAIDHLLNRME